MEIKNHHLILLILLYIFIDLKKKIFFIYNNSQLIKIFNKKNVTYINDN